MRARVAQKRTGQLSEGPLHSEEIHSADGRGTCVPNYFQEGNLFSLVESSHQLRNQGPTLDCSSPGLCHSESPGLSLPPAVPLVGGPSSWSFGLIGTCVICVLVWRSFGKAGQVPLWTRQLCAVPVLKDPWLLVPSRLQWPVRPSEAGILLVVLTTGVSFSNPQASFQAVPVLRCAMRSLP